MWLAVRESGQLQRAPYATIFALPYRGRLAFASFMWLLQVVPLFAIYTYAPTFLHVLGLGGENSPAGSVAIAAAFAVGALAAMPLIECWGRRPLCIAGFAVATVSFAVLFFANAIWMVVAFIAYAIGMGAATVLELVYPAELFPTEVRATATGFAAAVSRVGAFVGTFALPVALARFGIAVVISSACFLSICGLVIALMWAPETKGVSIS